VHLQAHSARREERFKDETMHCCERMSEELGRHAELGGGRFHSPDALVSYSPKFNEYGLIVHDGGSSFVQIHYCPWCGSKFSESERDRWFDELEQKGIDPTGEIPEKYRTDEWWRHVVAIK
jgi:hypothetical protein